MMKWVSIDFGTCNTAAAIEIDGAPHIVAYGNQNIFPTIACVLDDGSVEVCQNAEPLRKVYPETFKQEFKLQISDALDINATTYTDIVAEILSFVKGCAESENNGGRIDGAILTIPSIYTANDPRKGIMLAAAKKAGFKEIEFLPEPIAAARHYSDISRAANTGLSLIYDLGGGTFDPALLEMTSGTAKLLGHDSGVKCGGQLFDKAIYDHVSGHFKQQDKPLSRSNRLEDYDTCRRLKESLSIKDSATQIFSNGEKFTLTRDTFNTLIQPHIALTLQSCGNLLSTAGRKWSDVKQVLLVGGSSAIPLITDMLTHHLMSHNASGVKIIRNTKGSNGEYNYRFATCLGGIISKIAPPAPPAEKIAALECGNRVCILKPGDNSFGRDESMDFRFDDPAMSRHHFTISVTKENGKYHYLLTTKSKSKATVINNIEALDLRYVPFSRISLELLDGFTIYAGNTCFTFRKPKTN